MKLFGQCLFSPQLYKIYRQGSQSEVYEPRGIERWGNRVISMANTLLNIGLYTSPFICMYIYKRGFFSYDEARQIGRLFTCIGCVLAVSFTMRGYGRSTNPIYVKFLQALTSPMTDKKVYLSGIRQYDFEFSAWPATYTVSARQKATWLEQHPFSKTAHPDLPTYQRATIQLLAFVATHTFGLRLIYPGSMAVIQSILWGSLFQGRTHLVEDYDGQRAKLRTADGNEIDTMFVDHRGQGANGRILVICCEGNSGFYEFGIMTTPAKAEYSALGWNHPGFAESTGLPYPSQEHNAIEAVMLYAIDELGFKPENIVMFGWSIGGYSAAWAAVNFPVKGLVLDATFDDLLPLAENHMPSSWSLLVKEVVRSYVDLNIAALVTQYNGPVQLVRRSEDEVICLRQGVIATNRGNFLLTKIIEQRHPEVLDKPLARAALVKVLGLQQRYWNTKAEFSTVSVITDYLRDVKSTHCAPLPEDTFVDIMNTIVEKTRATKE